MRNEDELQNSQSMPGSTCLRDPKGRFLDSGNPKGTKSIWAQMYKDHQVYDSIHAMMEKAIDMAIEGNADMLKFFLRPIIPAVKRDNPIATPGLSFGSPSDKSNMIIKRVEEGGITPLEGEALMNLIVKHTGMEYVEAMDQRLKRIEDKAGLE